MSRRLPLGPVTGSISGVGGGLPEAVCDAGTLQAGSPRSGMLPTGGWTSGLPGVCAAASLFSWCACVSVCLCGARGSHLTRAWPVGASLLCLEHPPCRESRPAPPVETVWLLRALLNPLVTVTRTEAMLIPARLLDLVHPRSRLCTWSV